MFRYSSGCSYVGGGGSGRGRGESDREYVLLWGDVTSSTEMSRSKRVHDAHNRDTHCTLRAEHTMEYHSVRPHVMCMHTNTGRYKRGPSSVRVIRTLTSARVGPDKLCADCVGDSSG